MAGKKEMKELQHLELVQRYYECLYGLKDMYLYKGVALCYLGKYKEAISDFVQYEVCSIEGGSIQ